MAVDQHKTKTAKTRRSCAFWGAVGCLAVIGALLGMIGAGAACGNKIETVKYMFGLGDMPRTLTRAMWDNAEAKRTRVQEGDLLISITADLGRTGVVTKEIAAHGAYINQHLTCIRINRSILNPIYVAYYMESEAGKQQFETQNQTGVKAGLNFNSINGLKLMIPNIDEQNQFDAFVQEINKSKATVQQGLDRLNLLKSALMQEYFG